MTDPDFEARLRNLASAKYKGLRPAQAHILGAYADAHTDSPDLAIELPTGVGKDRETLILVRAHPRRRNSGPRTRRLPAIPFHLFRDHAKFTSRSAPTAGARLAPVASVRASRSSRPWRPPNGRPRTWIAAPAVPRRPTCEGISADAQLARHPCHAPWRSLLGGGLEDQPVGNARQRASRKIRLLYPGSRWIRARGQWRPNELAAGSEDQGGYPARPRPLAFQLPLVPHDDPRARSSRPTSMSTSELGLVGGPKSVPPHSCAVILDHL